MTSSFCFNDSIRESSPAETLKKLHQLFQKVGITRVAHITYFDHFYGVFVSNCIRPNSKNLSISQGKGSTLELSMVSAIMESMEAYHAEDPPASKFKCSFSEQESKSFIDPRFFCLTAFSGKLETAKLEWSEAISLIDKKSTYIPTVLTRINTCQPSFDYLYFNVSSNGLAGGNTKEEAMCHAILEVIERDALTKWQRMDEAAKSIRSIDPNSVDDFNGSVIEKLWCKNLTLRIWEITSNLGVPVYHAAIIEEGTLRGLNIFTGTGAHLSKSIALFRAISEAVQGRLTYITGARDDVFESYYKTMRSNNDRRFLPRDKISYEGKNYLNSISMAVNSVHENLQTLLDVLKKHQYSQVLMVDHTKPTLDIPVVQIFIPGMLLNNARM